MIPKQAFIPGLVPECVGKNLLSSAIMGTIRNNREPMGTMTMYFRSLTNDEIDLSRGVAGVAGWGGGEAREVGIGTGSTVGLVVPERRIGGL
jgi:hypothetical protein